MSLPIRPVSGSAHPGVKTPVERPFALAIAAAAKRGRSQSRGQDIAHLLIIAQDPSTDARTLQDLMRRMFRKIPAVDAADKPEMRSIVIALRGLFEAVEPGGSRNRLRAAAALRARLVDFVASGPGAARRAEEVINRLAPFLSTATSHVRIIPTERR